MMVKQRTINQLLIVKEFNDNNDDFIISLKKHFAIHPDKSF